MYPTLKINKTKLGGNVRHLKDLAESKGINICCVTKAYSAIPEIIDIYYENGIREFADSRIENLKNISYTGVKRWLLRLPMISEAREVVKYSDISLNSEIDTVEALGKSAVEFGLIHNVILMIDLGDLREGVLPVDAVETAKAFIKVEGIHLIGVGVNFNCFGGVIPTERNIKELVSVADTIEKECNIKLEIISGGNSGTMYMVANDTLDKRVNNLRVGDVTFSGQEASFLGYIDGLSPNVFTAEFEVIEYKEKTSVPIGETFRNAFGEFVTFEDKGPMKRAILACGRQDVNIDHLVPHDKDIELIGSSSDHIIADFTNKKTPTKIGDIVTFDLEYGAVLSLTTSKYVKKEIY